MKMGDDCAFSITDESDRIIRRQKYVEKKAMSDDDAYSTTVSWEIKSRATENEAKAQRISEKQYV